MKTVQLCHAPDGVGWFPVPGDTTPGEYVPAEIARNLLERLEVRVKECPCVGDGDFPTNLRCEECQADLKAIAAAREGEEQS